MATRNGEKVWHRVKPDRPMKVVHSTELVRTRWFELRKDELLARGGRPLEHFVLEVPLSAAVVPVSEKGEILLIIESRII